MKSRKSIPSNRRSHVRLAGVALWFGPVCLTGLGAATTTSEPLGFVTIEAAGGSAASPANTFIAPAFVNPAEWTGSIAQISGKTITAGSAAWTAGQFEGSSYLEITSGPHAGTWAGIVQTSQDSITTNDDLSGLVTSGTSAVIRRFTALSDFLGAANQAGLQAGPSLASSDEVVVYDGASPTVYWYYDGSGGGAGGWYDTAYHPAANVIIPPGHGVVLKRKNPASLSFPVSGVVKRGPSSVAVGGNLSVLGNPSALALSLSASQLYTADASSGLAAGSSLAGADQVVIYGASGPAIYWYYDGTQGGTAGWYDSSYQPAPTAAIPAAASFAVQRKSGIPFHWQAPAQIP